MANTAAKSNKQWKSQQTNKHTNKTIYVLNVLLSDEEALIRISMYIGTPPYDHPLMRLLPALLRPLYSGPNKSSVSHFLIWYGQIFVARWWQNQQGSTEQEFKIEKKINLPYFKYRIQVAGILRTVIISITV